MAKIAVRLQPSLLAVVCCALVISAGAADTSALAAPRALGNAHTGARVPEDLSGTWEQDFLAGNFFPNNKSSDLVFTLSDGTVIPLLPDAEKIYRGRVAMGETANVFANTAARCLPLGTPQNMMGAPPYPMRIVQRPEFIAILLEEGWEFRAIYMNGKHPEESIPSFMGHSIGHWEDDTLVVDRVNFDDRMWLLYYISILLICH